MGLDFRATALIGVEIDVKLLYIPIAIRGCEHTETNDSFCGQCGKPIWKWEIRIREEFCNPKYPEDLNDGKVFKDLSLSGTTWNERTETPDRMFLGVSVKSWGDSDEEASRIDIPDIDEVQQQLIEFLDPLGLWDIGKFGLWSLSSVG